MKLRIGRREADTVDQEQADRLQRVALEFKSLAQSLGELVQKDHATIAEITERWRASDRLIGEVRDRVSRADPKRALQAVETFEWASAVLRERLEVYRHGQH